MSLLNDAMETCVMIRRATVPDGYGCETGGETGGWIDGAEFQAAIVFDSSMQARTAQAAGVKSLYTITTRRAKVLEFHEVFRRKSDGKIFRVTSDGDDRRTPKSAGLDMRQVTAEEWRLPNE